MTNGKIGVTTENIFPVIKKFLYSDHEIFLRELVSNAVDATQKLKALASRGEMQGELGDLTIRIAVDTDKRLLTITDRGIGMTADEVQALWQRGYDPRQFLTPELDRVLQMLTSGVLGQRFDDVAASLLTPRFGAADSYMTVADFASYKAAKAHAVEGYQDRTRFAKMSLTNIARAGIFSSDRSVEQYAREIWEL